MTSPAEPLNILLSAYACEPARGSEPGVGWQWALALARRGHSVTVVTRANNRPVIEAAMSQRPEATRLRFVYHDLDWALRFKRGAAGIYLYYALWQRSLPALVAREHRRAPFDLIHHITMGGWRQPTLLERIGAPLVVGPVGGGEAAPRPLIAMLPLKARLFEVARTLSNRIALANPTLRRSLGAAAKVVARTPETRAWIARLGVAAEVSLEIGADADAQAPAVRTAAGRGALHCLFVGRLIGWKGVHLAIDAVAAARRAGADVTLEIVGVGPMGALLERRAAACGIAPAVTFLGRRPQGEIFDLYRTRDVLLFPSLHDSGGTVVIEALSHGLPVVCLQLGGPGEMVDRRCGEAVDAEGAHDAVVKRLGAALVRLANDRDDLVMLSAGAANRARELSWDNVVDRVYRSFDRAESPGQPVDGGSQDR